VAESGWAPCQPLNAARAFCDEPFAVALYDAARRSLAIARRRTTGPLVSKQLGIVEAHLERRDLARALREIDWTWRHVAPDTLPALAGLYGRLLSLEGRDHSATHAMLQRASLAAPDPEVAALIAWTLARDGQHDAARRQIRSTLTTFCVVPGDLLAQVAGQIAFSPSSAAIGWFGLGPNLAVHGEIIGGETDSALDIAIDGKAAFTQLVRGRKGGCHSSFSLATSTLSQALRVDITAMGEPLLGSGLINPPDFAVDGRASTRGHHVTGWARLGWRPAQRPRIRVTDERGTQYMVKSAARPPEGYRWTFTIDLRAAHLTGNRLEISVELPGGGWHPLPDAPLLIERASHSCKSWTASTHRLNQPAKSQSATRPVDVIIPVYRDLRATLSCIDSVIRTVGDEATLIIVDDATEDPELPAELDKLARQNAITLLRNISNQGFVRSVNRALALNPDHDAILLNSDTVVFGDWLERLRSAAYSRPRIGTVTPLSNNGSIFSYPRATGGEMAVETAARLHNLTAGTAPGHPIEIPVGVGFCLYLRRDCLLDSGSLDEAAFDKGYGEETDLCLRARHRGWTHVLAPDVFVYHSGGLSFGSRRTALLERSQRILNLRYPGYDALIAKFLAADPLACRRRQLDERRLLALGTRMVLIVTLALSGGVDRFVKEHCEVLRQHGIVPLLLRPAAPGDRKRCELTVPGEDFLSLRYEVPSEVQSLSALLGALPIDRIEIQHFLHLDSRVIEAVRKLSIPYDLFVHDYAWICPRVTLIDGTGRYCGEPASSTCDRCVRRNGSALGESLSVATLRARSRRWITEARDVFAPSADTAARIRRYTDRTDITVRPHSISAGGNPTRSLPRRRDSTRVALIGAIGTHKGFRQLLHCARDARERHLPLEFVVIGHTENDAPLLATGRVFITGPYDEGEASYLLQREKVDVAWFPSVWPETWCYTLDEAIDAGLPIVTFDIGAIAERVRDRPDSTALPLSLEPHEINDHLMRAGNSPAGTAVATLKSNKPRVRRAVNDAKMDPDQPGGLTVNDNSYSKTQQTTVDTEMTAAVQVLPLPGGLYLFSVKAATPAIAATTGALSLPAVHVGLGPGITTDSVEFVGGPSTHGCWLFAKGDLLVTKVKGTGATLVLTSMRAPGGETLSIKVERLEARADDLQATVDSRGRASSKDDLKQPAPLAAQQHETPTSDSERVPVRIGAHIRTRGDMMFSDVQWAGRVAPGLWIESFSVRPLERFTAHDIEYKALTGSGFETPWLSDEKMCGTQGMSSPLVGFAIRLKPSSLAAAYDCEYMGYFQSGTTVGPLRNGVPCRSSVASDPLEGIQVRVIKRSATMSSTVGLVVGESRSVTARSERPSKRRRIAKKLTRAAPRRGSA
jgi:GT2 family glycosyltransferase